MFLVSRCGRFGWLIPAARQCPCPEGGGAAWQWGLHSEPCASGQGLQPCSAGSPARAVGEVLHPRSLPAPSSPREGTGCWFRWCSAVKASRSQMGRGCTAETNTAKNAKENAQSPRI